MGIESFDRTREETRRARGGRSHRHIAISVIVAAAFLLAVLRPAAAREPGETGLRLELLPGLPSITIGEKSL